MAHLTASPKEGLVASLMPPFTYFASFQERANRFDQNQKEKAPSISPRDGTEFSAVETCEKMTGRHSIRGICRLLRMGN